MSKIEKPSSQGMSNIQPLYFATRRDDQKHRELMRESLARDLHGNPLLVDGKQDYLDFVPIYLFSKDEIETRANLWETYFGENGLSTFKPKDEVEKDMRLIENALAVAGYAHQSQKRGTGEFYLMHVIRAALHYAEEHKAPAWRAAGLLVHDAVEDSDGKIELEDIKHHLGEKVAKMVDRLTKVRKLQKISLDNGEVVTQAVTDRKATELKLINAMDTKDPDNGTLAGPLDLAAKISGDVRDNINTLRGKTPGEQVNIASYALDYWGRLANLFGMTADASFIRNTCYEIVDRAYHEDGLINKIKKGIAIRFRNFDPKQIEKLIGEMFNNSSQATSLGYYKTDISTPDVFDVAQRLKGRRDLTEGDFSAKQTIILTDEAENTDTFNHRALQAVTQLISGKNYSLADDSGLEDFLKATQSQQDDIVLKKVKLIYHDERGKKVHIDVRVIRKSQYDIESTPITYFEAEELLEKDKTSGEYTLEERRQLARQKLTEITELFSTIADNPDIDEGLIFPHTITTLDGITVFGIKEGKEIMRAPVPPGSTVMDYALFHLPGAWRYIRPVFKVNNNSETDLAMILNPGDTIEFDIGKEDENHTSTGWLDAANTYPNAVQTIAPRLEKRLEEMLPKERTEITKKIRHRGWKVVSSRLAEKGIKLNDFGLSYGHEAFPNPKTDPRDFAYHVGLGKVNQETVDKVVSHLAETWNNFTVLRVRIAKANESGRSAPIQDIIQQYGLNMIGFKSSSKWGDTASLIIRFDKNDLNYKKLNTAISEIKEKLGYDSLVFENDQEHKKWLERHTEDID